MSPPARPHLAGEVLTCRVVAVGQTVPAYHGQGSLVELADGTRGFLCDEDLLWSIGMPEPDSALAEVARRLLGEAIEVAVLLESGPERPVLLGRKQRLANPMGYVRNNLDLAFEGIVQAKGPAAAHVLMDLDWAALGHDRLSRVVGTVVKGDCSLAVWTAMDPGSRLRLRLGPCDFAQQILRFVPVE